MCLVCDNLHQAVCAFEKDWELDSQGCAHLGKQKFFTAIFEFIDHWCHELTPHAYLEEMNRLWFYLFRDKYVR